jgi:hypothetical protein
LTIFENKIFIENGMEILLKPKTAVNGAPGVSCQRETDVLSFMVIRVLLHCLLSPNLRSSTYLK